MSSRTAHEKAHKYAEERLERLKWPWERVVNGGYDEESDEEERQYSNKELYRKFKLVQDNFVLFYLNVL